MKSWVNYLKTKKVDVEFNVDTIPNIKIFLRILLEQLPKN
jgi:hypothetical protein